MDISPPELLYRVQWDNSFTVLQSDGSLSSNAYCNHFDPDQWITSANILGHLDANARPAQPTPFIAVYDYLTDASKRAQSLADKGEANIRIIEINMPAAIRMDVTMSREIAVLEGVPSFPVPAQFPIWEQKVTTAAGVQLMRAFSLKAVKTQLGVQISSAQERMWFVIDHIYGEMVIRKIKFD